MSDKPDEAAALAAAEAVVVPLSKPIPAYNEQISELRFRRPTAADIIAIGNPVHFHMLSDPPLVEHHPQRMTAMMAKLANIPSSSIALMEPNDWVSCAWALSPFFIPRVGTV